MFAKLITLLALAAVALCREYPAGVHPAVCPNYPYCDTSALARHTPDGQPIPEWVRNPSILPVAPVERTLQYPEGVNPALCPNYPFCDGTTLARHYPNGQPIPEWIYNPSILPVAPVDPAHNAAPRYPADFPAALCPNYPYCW